MNLHKGRRCVTILRAIHFTPLTLEHMNRLEEACACLATGGRIDATMLRLGDTSLAGLTEQLQSITRLHNAGVARRRWY
jgi:hypothetical protein